MRRQEAGAEAFLDAAQNPARLWHRYAIHRWACGRSRDVFLTGAARVSDTGCRASSNWMP